MARKGTLRTYEQALIDAYYDAWMHRALDPLHEAFVQWQQGDVRHDQLMDIIHKVHRENQQIYSFFTQSRGSIIACIRMNQAWFDDWRANNPPPPGIEM